ncbi:hypothetical protein WJX72_008276 [[Myrmecia] bisecta]|uniref:Rieske domain-containing protein n=1 Tax=[Myrmecia] bisecta TaxID=41462 RepID=A0AAW1P406_9CHLO
MQLSGVHRKIRNRQTVSLRAAAEEEVATQTQPTTSTMPEEESNFVPVLKPEDLPKGVRKEVRVQGVNALLFWYRNQIYAIEARSPAEGAYSEGFIKAKFTQDYAIECPATASTFSLKTGEIVDWYPTNPVLRVLTPKDTCRPMDIYPVKLTQDAILVDVSGAATTRAYAVTKGGSDTSLENNNVYGLEPKVYLEGSDPLDPIQTGGPKKASINPYTLVVGTLALAGTAVAGSALAIYFESFVALGIFWVALFGAVAAFVVQYNKED